MPRKKTASDDALERRIYEEAARDEETFLMLRFKELLADMPAPEGWRNRHKPKDAPTKPGRPRKKKPGHQDEFSWQGMMLVLLLKTLHGLTYRETTSHLRANPWLWELMGLPRAPSPKTIRVALNAFPEKWLKEMNRRLVEPARGGGAGDRFESDPRWIVLEYGSKGQALGFR